MKRIRQHQTRGYLLVDLLITMSAIAVVLSMSSVWVYKTLRYSTEVNQRAQQVRSISRVGHQLRADAFDATSIRVDGESLSIESDGQTIRYEIQSNLLQRETSGSKTVHRDRFEFAPNAVLQWQLSGDDAVLLNIGRDYSDMSASKTKTDRGLDSQIRVSVMPEESR